MYELQQGYPVLASGYSFKTTKRVLGIKINTTYSGGHQWLIHGLLERRRYHKTYLGDCLSSTQIESEWYVLCNWAWSSGCDGYFLSGVFDANKGPSYYDGTSSSRSDSEEESSGEEANYKLLLSDKTR